MARSIPPKVLNTPEAAPNISGAVSLYELPTELRLHVYEFLFTTESVFVCRGDWCSKRIIQDPHITTIFLTCRAIYEEAKPVFYSTCQFHIAQTHRVPGSHIEQHQDVLKNIKNLNISWACMSVGDLLHNPPFANWSESVDAALAASLTFFADECTNLHSLNLHLIDALRYSHPMDGMIEHALIASGKSSEPSGTLAAITRLAQQTRDKVRLVAYTQDEDRYNVITKAIERVKVGSKNRTCKHWPLITLPTREKYYLLELQGYHLSPFMGSRKIWVWDFGNVRTQHQADSHRVSNDVLFYRDKPANSLSII